MIKNIRLIVRNHILFIYNRFIDGCAALASMSDLFKKVVPLDQTFEEKEYAGIFHFRFWIFGHFYDVVIGEHSF